MRGAPGVFAFHPANGGYRKPVEAAIMKGLGVVAGVPDIIAIYRSRVFALEIKTEIGRVTDVQRAVHDRMRRAGAIVGVAFGLNEALRWLEQQQLLKHNAAPSKGAASRISGRAGSSTSGLANQTRARGSNPRRSTTQVQQTAYGTPPKASQLP